MNTYQRAILQRMDVLPPLPIGTIWPQQQYRTLRRAMQRLRQMGHVARADPSSEPQDMLPRVVTVWWITPAGRKALAEAMQEEKDSVG